MLEIDKKKSSYGSKGQRNTYRKGTTLHGNYKKMWSKNVDIENKVRLPLVKESP